jgi:mycofactocin precursor
MTMSTAPDAATGIAAVPAAVEEQHPFGEDDPELVEEDLLVEDVSIDGMCGVY